MEELCLTYYSTIRCGIGLIFALPCLLWIPGLRLAGQDGAKGKVQIAKTVSVFSGKPDDRRKGISPVLQS